MPRGLDRRGGRARRRLDGVLFKKRPTMSDGDDGEEDRATASQLRQIPHVPSSARAVMGNSLKSTGTEKAVRSVDTPKRTGAYRELSTSPQHKK